MLIHNPENWDDIAWKTIKKPSPGLIIKAASQLEANIFLFTSL
jgi:hypothetical protein